MLTLQRPDPKVSVLLGENKGIKSGDRLRPSLFAIPMELGKRKVVLNTFTGHCIETEKDSWFREPGKLTYDEGDAEMKDLVAYDYLVRDDFDEVKKYMEILSILRRTEKRKQRYSGYTILPTTCCNARCVYCYELGLKHETMSEETLEQTIRYIHATRKKEGPVHFHWFGGEPLIGEKHIDRICKSMREAGVEYTSTMISNGSLMTEKTAFKAKEDWRLNSVQITLDGREDVYCRRKRYRAFKGSPYRAALDGIRALLNQRIRVSIRLNVDEENLDELMLLVDELEQAFEKETLVSIYCHSIFAEAGDSPDRNNDMLYRGMEKLNDRLEEFNRNRRKNSNTPNEVSQDSIDDAAIQWESSEDRCPEDAETKEEKERKKGEKNYYDRRGYLKRYYCMVDSPAAGPVILPDGRFNLCEHIGELPTVGNVYDMLPVDKAPYIARNRANMDKCRKCGLFPVCTDFTGCPTVSRDCYKETLAKEKNKLRGLEEETRLPPVSIKTGDQIIRVTEPTVEFIKANRSRIVPSYYNTEMTLGCDDAKDLLGQPGVNLILEFHLTDHCNLSCRYCAHYAPVAKERFATMDEVAEAMRVAQLIKPHRLNILGGEPLLHPQIDEMLAYIGENMPGGANAFLTTNGILLSRMSDQFWKVLKEHDIAIYLSIYPAKLAYQKQISLTKSKGIRLAGLSHPMLQFHAVRLAEDKRYDPKLAYAACRAKCMQIRDGRLYPCPYSAYIDHINTRYGTTFTHENGDYLSIDKITDGRMVAQWMKEPKPFCARCNSGKESLRRWERTENHDEDEWVER